jgi:Type II intron maturase
LALLDRATRTKMAQSKVVKKGKRTTAAVKRPTVVSPPPPPPPPPTVPTDENRKDPMDSLPIIRFPSHRRNFACMVCANFVKRGPDKHVYGCGHTKVLSQRYEYILAYYSRMTEAFGNSHRIRYLMKDSLACTLMRKHKLRSRAAAYKKFHGIKEFPMPNRLRPIFFRSDKAIPFVPQCRRIGSRRWTSCYDVYAAKLLDNIPNYQARANVVAYEKELKSLEELMDDDDNDDIY